MRKLIPRFFIVIAFIILCHEVSAQRKMERLGRGVVATRNATNKVLVSWRLLGTEPQDIGFNLYRSANGGNPVKLNSNVLLEGTNFEDLSASASANNTYHVKPVIAGVEKEAGSGSFTLPANTPTAPYIKVPIRNVAGYQVRYIFVGDLDGNGEFDFVIHKTPISDGTKTDLVEAYKHDGTYLWTLDGGPNSVERDNIYPGSSALNCGHGDNITVYDINRDGKSEVIMRTANGVKFADGSTVAETDNRKQFMSVIDGVTGREISRTLYNNPYIQYGPMNGHLGIAYLDGINPSLVWEAANRNSSDGAFKEMVTAWDWNGSTLVQKWVFDLVGKKIPSGHQFKIFDIDGDGKDEIIPQAYALDDDGSLMYNLLDQAIDHGDRFSISDLDPSRPGLELYGIQQGYSKLGIMWYYCDAKTGKVLLSQSNPANPDMGRGMNGDFDPRYNGHELYTFVEGLYNVSGAVTSTKVFSSYPNMRIWWDADLGSELLDNGKFVKWDYLNNWENRLLTISGVTQNGRTTPAFYGDILGDWREETIYESTDHDYIVIYTTPNYTTERIYTLAHNPGYRNDMAVRGYYQSHNTDFYLGYNMQQPPIPAIQEANRYWVGNTSVWDKSLNNWTDGTSAKTFADGDTIMFDIRGKNADTIRLNTNASPARIWAMNPLGKDYVVSGSGKLTGATDFWKAKDGIFTLKGNHDYTGATMVTEGQLNIDGSLQSKVTVKGMGAVGGRGTFAGGLVLDKGINAKGGRISPGFGDTAEKLGSIKVDGNLAVSGDNNFEFDVVPGSVKVNDSLIVTGNLTVAGVNKLILKFAGNIFTPGTYTLISCKGTLTASAGNFELDGISGVSKELLIENNEVKIKINVSRSPADVVWNGTTNNLWDFDKRNFLLNTAPTAFVSKDNITFNSAATQKIVILNDILYPNSVTFDSNSDYVISGTGDIAGTTGITKNNTNNLSILSTGNTYTGKTIINGGTLTVAKLGLRNEPSSIGAADSAAANIQINNATLAINERSTTDRSITISGTSVFNVPTSNSYAIFMGNIKGAGTLVKEGEGAIFMVGAKDFTGPVVIKAGAINLRTKEGNIGGLGSSNNITIENATLSMEDVRDYARATWNLIIPEGKNATLNTDGRSTLAGSLTGAGTLNVKIPYVRTDFKGDWSQFAGKIVVSANDFRIGNTSGYGKASMHLAGGKIYTISGASSSVAIGELSGVAGTSLSSDISSTTWVLGAKNTDATFSGDITETALTKVGTGTLALNGNNTYLGNTAVNAGRLLVNNAVGKRGIGSGSVTVANGAILGGTGGIKGAITVSTGGKIQPGADGIGTLSDSTSVTLSNGAIAEMEINKGNATFDVLKVAGTITFAGTLYVTNIASTNFRAGDSYKLFEATTYQGNFSAIEPASPGTGLIWQFSNTSGILSVIADPNLVFTLPAKNFKISAVSETCASSNNGKIRIEATEPFNYKATLNGNTANVYSFTSTAPLEISNLQAGNYEVCITVEGQADYKLCHPQIRITEPPALSVYSSVNVSDKTVYLSLGGGEAYEVELNGEIFETTSGTLTLNLAEGRNTLIVRTDKDCQGVFNKTILIGDEKLIYPNPFDQTLFINMGNDSSETVRVSLFSLSGAEAYFSNHVVNSKDVEIDLSALASGTYIIKIKTARSESVSKIVKK